MVRTYLSIVLAVAGVRVAVVVASVGVLVVVETRRRRWIAGVAELAPPR